MNNLDLLQAQLERDKSELHDQPAWPGGWPDDIETALIDAGVLNSGAVWIRGDESVMQ